VWGGSVGNLSIPSLQDVEHSECRRPTYGSSGQEFRGKGVHKIPMFTFREREEKVNNDLIIPMGFLHTF
jgi:hypothetical protein